MTLFIIYHTLVKKDLVLSKINKDLIELDIKEIPLIIFNKLSVEFGIAEKEYDVYVGTCYVEKWKIKKTVTGHFLAYTERTSSNAWKQSIIEIWALRIEKENLSELKISNDEIKSIFNITAGSFPDGSWGYGSGRGIEEKINVKLPLHGLFIGNPVVQLIHKAILEANLMAMDPKYTKDCFCENDKDPGEYKAPPF